MANQEEVMQWLVDNYPDHIEDRDNVRSFVVFHKLRKTFVWFSHTLHNTSMPLAHTLAKYRNPPPPYCAA